MSRITEIMQSMDYGLAPESASEAQRWLNAQGPQPGPEFGLWIGGQAVAASSHFDSLNPASGQVLARVGQATSAQVQQAVDAAQAALPAWQALGGHGRARHLYALARTLQKHARLAAVLESLDNGKTIRESRDIDIPLAIRHFYHHAGWAQLLDSEFPAHEAIGVVGQIVPWNFPLLMLAWKVAPALACGNTVVFKPAEQTSLTALLFAQLSAEAGLPPGVFNLVTGDGAVGEAIVGHPGIGKIAFTGSTEVGRHIRRATAGSGKKLSLELGGKSPFVVFADADLDAAVEGLVDGIWLNQGQVCCAGSRLLVHEGTAERLLAKVRQRMKHIRVGDPLDKSVDMGPLVDRVQWARVNGFVERARAEGAVVLQDCASSVDFSDSAGCYFRPTLVTGVDTASEIVRDEVFGPVLCVMTFRTPAEAVELANHTAYGLAASVWSESIGQAMEVAAGLNAGVVWVNGANLFDAACGFGGVRESGFGREGGREGLVEYLKARQPAAPAPAKKAQKARNAAAVAALRPAIDRTAKLYIGGAQARPDSGYSREVRVGGEFLGVVPEGNRKDIRNAVEAAVKAVAWRRTAAHARAQVLFYVAENLLAHAARFEACLAPVVGPEQARAEVEASARRLFTYAAWADKFDGAVHQPPMHGLALALHEPVGTVAIVAPADAPLLGLISLVAPAIAMGNRVVAVPSVAQPMIAAELYALLQTSDLPGGVLNLVTGDADALTEVLAAHMDVDALWHHDARPAVHQRLEAASAGNLKRTWVAGPSARDWFDAAQGEGREFLQHATRVKNIWVPYGV
jgi:aldehyde dehydrogenase (NAD+)